MTKDGNPNLALRIQVESGGCHGFQYLMSLKSYWPVVDHHVRVFYCQKPSLETDCALLILDIRRSLICEPSRIPVGIACQTRLYLTIGWPGSSPSGRLGPGSPGPVHPARVTRAAAPRARRARFRRRLPADPGRTDRSCARAGSRSGHRRASRPGGRTRDRSPRRACR